MTPRLVFRLILGDDIALGPGKVQLLEAIQDRDTKPGDALRLRIEKSV